MNKRNIAIVVHDVSIVTFFFTVNAFLFEFQYPGFVSILIDMNMLILVFALSLFVSFIVAEHSAYTSFHKFVIGVGLPITFVNLYRFSSLQHHGGLLGLGVGVCIVGLFIALTYFIYDRRSTN